MNVSERLAASAVVPVIVLDDAKDAVATARALLAGGVDVMEITFRTAAAASSQLTPMCATSKPSAADLACLQSSVIFSNLPAAMSAFGQTQLPPTA